MPLGAERGVETQTRRQEWSGRARPWVIFVARRIAVAVVGIVAILFVTFTAVRLIPGDAVLASVNPALVTTEYLAARRQELGLDLPWHLAFLQYASQALQLNFGTSFAYNRPVIDVLAPRAEMTALLAGCGFAIAVLLAIPAGMLAAIAQRRRRFPLFQRSFTGISGFLSAVPEYLLAVALVFLFAVTLRLLPVAGATSILSLVIPALAIGLAGAGILSRIVRNSTQRVLAEDFVRTAFSSRLRPSRIYLRHVLPNVLPAVLTYAGIVLGGLLGGTMVVETVMAWPGLGVAMADAVTTLDYPMVQGVVTMAATAVLLVNIVVDLTLAVIDPRSKLLES